MQNTIKKPVLRIDKNLALNTLDFKNFFEDAHYARKLIYYICFQYYNDPEGFGFIDPKDFCQRMNVSFSRMKETVKEPQQLIEKMDLPANNSLLIESNEDVNEVIWKTRFENILYKLNSTVFKYSYGGNTTDGYEYRKVDSGTLLKSIGMEFKSVAKTKKKYYTFEADPQIVNNLTKWFNEMDMEAFLKLNDHQDLLTYLYNLKSLFQSPKFKGKKVISYELLCKLVNTNCAAFKDNKKAIWAAINKIRKVDTKLNISSAEWIKGGKNDNVAADLYIDFVMDKVSIQDKYGTLIDRFDSRLITDLSIYFRSKYKEYSFPVVSTEEEKKFFRNWFKNNGVDLDIKTEYYNKTKKYIYGDNVRFIDNEGLIFFKTGRDYNSENFDV